VTSLIVKPVLRELVEVHILLVTDGVTGTGKLNNSVAAVIVCGTPSTSILMFAVRLLVDPAISAGLV
jgi:hypothetical protein